MLAEHKALGLIGTPEFFSGIDKMETTIKWTSLYADAISKSANPTAAVNLQCRASLEDWTSSGRTSEQPAVVSLTGTFKTLPLGNFKAHENAEYESQLAVSYVKLEIGGVAVVEIDVISNIYKVNGVDILANYRANLGA